MNKVLIFTRAFNAEKTVARAIESVLAQTYADFIYYVLDNGSTDRTSSIIKEYAATDRRVVLLRNDINNIGYWEFHEEIVHNSNFDNDDYYCVLDADDEYKPRFLKKMIAFAGANDFDLVACGYDYINAITGELMEEYRLTSAMAIRTNSEFCTEFRFYHKTMRPFWAKIVKFSVLRRMDLAFLPLKYGGDTQIVFRILQNVSSVGILNESLHKYHVSQSSNSRKLDACRFESDVFLFDDARDFLIKKCGFVSPQNREFLLIVYMNAINNTLNVLLNAEIPEMEKITGVLSIFSHEHTQQMAALENIGMLLGSAEIFTRWRRDLFASVATWLLSREEVQDEQIGRYCDVGEFVSAAAGNADAWVFFKKLRARFFIDRNRADEARIEVNELEELLPDDKDVISLKRQLIHSSI
jgi:glycosyltransferase involved in cell wall biosynthesis